MNVLTTAPAAALVLLTAACGTVGSTPEESARATSTASAAREPASAGSSSTPGRDLADLPLLHGWPTQAELGSDGTITGPSAEMEPITFTACGRTVRFDSRERVDARLVGIEDERMRAVGRHRDDAEAEGMAADLVALFQHCPEEPQDALTEVHRVAGGPQAQAGAVVTSSFRYDGADALGAVGTVVLQRGRTVVVSTMSSEGLGQEHARRLARQQLRQLQPLLAELE